VSMYFFHNIYGDEADLLDSLPDSVTAVPFGWTEEAESYRNEILSEIGASVSSLPCVLVYVPEHFADSSKFTNLDYVPQDHRVVGFQKVPSRWVEFSFMGITKPWSWEKMLEVINSYHQ
jgi:hypothetical protein